MPVIQYLERNAKMYGSEVALVELNPDEQDKRRSNWKEAELSSQPSLNHSVARLHGVFLTKRLTALQTCF